MGFDEGAGVVGDQPAQRGVGVVGVAQVAGAVEWVEAGRGQAGRVADVVQPPGGFQEIGVSAKNMVPGCVPGRRRLGRAPTGGGGAPEGVPERDVRPRKPACSWAQTR